MPDVNALFADYASYHRTAGNKWFHRFGIPMIMLSLIGMLTRVEIFSINSFRIDLAMVLILASSVYYLALEWRLGHHSQITDYFNAFASSSSLGTDNDCVPFSDAISTSGMRRLPLLKSMTFRSATSSMSMLMYSYDTPFESR